jgi:hypothetical protein
MTTRNKDKVATKEMKPRQGFKDHGYSQIGIWKGRDEGVLMKNEKAMIYSEANSHFRADDSDVEIKVVMNDELTDLESKLFEERYFIPIERAESPSKVCSVNHDQW